MDDFAADSGGLRRDALGVGLRVPHYETVCQKRPALDYFELLSENYLTADTPARGYASRVQEHYPVVLHGVGLNLLGAAPLDEAYLISLRALADALDAEFVTDHLCWSASGGLTHHDLLPTPFTPELAEYAAERASHVQSLLGRPFGIENLSSYVSFATSTMTEWDFYASVVKDARCAFMLDLNNVYVSSLNHGFDPARYLDAIDFSNVLQVHVAGHDARPGVVVDTHDRAVSEGVWHLYERAWKSQGPFRTLLEWDDAIPPFEVMLRELDRARGFQT